MLDDSTHMRYSTLSNESHRGRKMNGSPQTLEQKRVENCHFMQVTIQSFKIKRVLKSYDQTGI